MATTDDIKHLLTSTARIEERVDMIGEDMQAVLVAMTTLTDARHNHHLRLTTLEQDRARRSGVLTWTVRVLSTILVGVVLWKLGITTLP